MAQLIKIIILRYCKGPDKLHKVLFIQNYKVLLKKPV